jgi:hypothetical protein
MLLIIAALLAMTWVILFAFVHVTGAALYALPILAVAGALFHFVRPRRYRAPASSPTPPDAIK